VYSGYKLKSFTASVSIIFAVTVMSLYSFPVAISAQHPDVKFKEAEIYKAESSGEKVTKRNFRKLKMEFEKVVQERNKYRRMVDVLRQRVDKLSRQLRRLKAMDSNDEQQLIELVKTNQRYESRIGKLRQENGKLKNRLEKQAEKLERMSQKGKDEGGDWEDVSLKEGTPEEKEQKVRLMEHKEMIKKIREALLENADDGD